MCKVNTLSQYIQNKSCRLKATQLNYASMEHTLHCSSARLVSESMSQSARHAAVMRPYWTIARMSKKAGSLGAPFTSITAR